jgi:hypothetical protein
MDARKFQFAAKFYLHFLCSVMLFKDQPKLLSSSLSQRIGCPRDFDENVKEASNFDFEYDLRIPMPKNDDPKLDFLNDQKTTPEVVSSQDEVHKSIN